MRNLNWIGSGRWIGLVLSLTALAASAGAAQWQIDRSADGAACHVRPVRGGTALPEAPMRHKMYPGRSEACRAALVLSEAKVRPCLLYSDASHQACDSGGTRSMSSELMALTDVKLPKAVLMERLTNNSNSLNRFGSARPQVIGSCTSQTSFPAAFVFASGDPSHESDLCTANLVGPRAMITAGHCVDPKLPYVAFLDQRKRKADQPTYTQLKCEKSETVDLAICAPLDEKVKFNASHYEKVSIGDPGPKGRGLWIAGFGLESNSDVLLGDKAGFFSGPVNFFTPAAAPENLMTLSGATKIRNWDSGGPVLDSCGVGRAIMGFIKSFVGPNTLATQNSDVLAKEQLMSWAKDRRFGICGLTTTALPCPALDTINCQSDSCTGSSILSSQPGSQPIR